MTSSAHRNLVLWLAIHPVLVWALVSCDRPADLAPMAAAPGISGSSAQGEIGASAVIAPAPPAGHSSEPTYLIGHYGVEKGNIGAKECDDCFGEVSRCTKIKEESQHGDGLLADMKQQRLAWKLAAIDANGDQGKLAALAAECKRACEPVRAELKKRGCGGN